MAEDESKLRRIIVRLLKKTHSVRGGFAAVAGSTDAAVSEEQAKYVNGAIKSDLSDSLHTM